jgi:hypothetical protein
MRNTLVSLVTLGVLLTTLPALATDGAFEIRVTGDIEAEIQAAGDLRCVSMGDSGPGYLSLRNGHRTDKVSFALPISTESGKYEITSWTKLAAAGEVGQGYSIEVSLPLKGFHKAIGATGTLELSEAGTSPGERIRGDFDVTSDSMGTEIRLQGTFDFIVPESAREEC